MASQALCPVGVAGVVIVAAGGGGGAAPGLGIHSPEHPERSRTPPPSWGPAGLAVAEVVAGVANVISAACRILSAFPSVVGRTLLNPVLIPRVRGEAGPRRLQRLSPVPVPRRRSRRSAAAGGLRVGVAVAGTAATVAGHYKASHADLVVGRH